jgi:hypothetical protein
METQSWSNRLKERIFPHQFVMKLLGPFSQKLDKIMRFSHGYKIEPGILSSKNSSVISRFLMNKKTSQNNVSGYPEQVYLESHDRQGISLTPAIERKLSEYLNIKLPQHHLLQSNRADQILEKRKADAMTIGNHIYFRRGQYQPQSSRGLGLIAHEIMHVIQNESKRDKKQENDISGYTLKDEINEPEHPEFENQALSMESFVYRQANQTGEISQKNVNKQDISPRMNNAANSSQSTPAVMFADSSRDFGPSLVEDTLNPATMTLSEDQFKHIKQEVYRDLMMRIKIDFERGA